MAITIHQNPLTYTPAYNPVVYVVSSSNSAQTNFKYIFDIYVSGVLRQRIKQLPRPTAEGIVDISNTIQDYLTQDIDTSTYGIQKNSSSYAEVQVKFGEEYGATPVVYADLSIGTTFYAFNGVLDFLDFPAASNIITGYTWNASNILPGQGKFLTAAPRIQYIASNQNAWLHLMQTETGSVNWIKVQTYNTSGDTVGIHYILNDYNDVTTVANRFLRVGIGTYNLNQIDASKLLAGDPGPIITNDVSYYTVQGIKTTGTAVNSETFTFYIDTTCTPFDVFRLHFINKLGGFDSFNFFKGDINTNEITRKTYNKIPAVSNTTTYNYTTKSQGTVSYQVKSQNKLHLISDWITDDQSEWLSELIDSPLVYMEVNRVSAYSSLSSYGIVPVTVKNSNYEQKKSSRDRLFNFEVDVEMSHHNYRQKG